MEEKINTNIKISERFSRNIGILSEKEQKRLINSSVAIVGLGCTGCAVVEYLARAGVGRFILIDGDSFEETNINRQIYARSSNLGKNKSVAAKEAIQEINPEAHVIVHSKFLTPENAGNFLNNSDLIVNGVDDPFIMVVLHRAAKLLGITSIFIMSGCIPFQGVCTTIPGDNSLDYETFMGLPTSGKPLTPYSEVRNNLFEIVSKRRILSALKRGAIPGPWVNKRINEGWLPSFGPTSNITAIIAANEAIKVLIQRPSLPPITVPNLIYYDGSKCKLEVKKPKPEKFWFQGDF